MDDTTFSTTGILLLVLGITFAIATCIGLVRWARRHGHNATAWGIFGFLMPLVAIIVAAFVKPNRRPATV